MRWDDISIPIMGPLLFAVAVFAFGGVVTELNCGLDDVEQPGDGPDEVWEWHRGQGVFRLTTPANLAVQFGLEQRGDRIDAIWTFNAQPLGLRFVGQLRCTLTARDGPCKEPPAIVEFGEGEENRAIITEIAASYEWEPVGR